MEDLIAVVVNRCNNVILIHVLNFLHKGFPGTNAVVDEVIVVKITVEDADLETHVVILVVAYVVSLPVE